MKIILWIIIIALLYVYISYYYRYPTKVSILQSRLNEFDLNLLNEKQPIVIEDRIKDINEIRKAWFKWNFKKEYNTYDTDKWYKNNFKYFLIHPQEDTEVFLYPPNKPVINNEPSPEEQIIVMKLKANQLLIVPYKWLNMIDKLQNVNFIGLNDIFTAILP
jgi:hypothetical protein